MTMKKEELINHMIGVLNNDAYLIEYATDILSTRYPNVVYNEANDDGVYYTLLQAVVNDIIIQAVSRSLTH